MVRLIVISNRVAVPGHSGQSQAGGLAVAIRPVLRRHPGIWFGWSGQVAAAPDVKVHTIQHGHQTYVLIDLGQEDYHEYYNGYANKVLWPILHYRLVSVREDIESDESFVIQGRRPDSVGEPPMWTAENRARYDRSRLRYPSDLTDEEWALISPRIPPARRGGNKRTVNLREIVNGLMYILSTGCQWRAIPKDLPPRSTLYDYFDLWNWDGTLDRIHHALYVECRERAEREASPTAAIIDSQSVKSAEKGGLTIRMDMMRARRSRARSDTFSSTRKAS